LTVTNNGAGIAAFTAGQVILLDDLPTSFSYLPPAVTSLSGVTGGASVACAIASATLTCTATGAVSIAPGGTMQVIVVATPTSAGTFANPRAGGTCAVDPGNSVPESDNANNSCSDSIVVANVPGAPVDPPQTTAVRDENKEDSRRLTRDQRRERERTNTAGEGDYRTEGFVIEVRCSTSVPPETEVSFPDHAPYLVIATMDGKQQLRLLYDTRNQCQSVRVGDYAEADGEKQHELLFDAHNLSTSR
jgi:hypothetical protein